MQKKVTHTRLPKIQVIENLNCTIRIKSKRIVELEAYLESKELKVVELEARIKAMDSKNSFFNS